jgi:bacillithiol synthase
MKVTTSIPYQDTSYFSKLFLDFIQQKPSLSPFFTKEEEVELVNYNLSDQQRDVLVSVLEKQTAAAQLSDLSRYNLQLLKEANTYTVCTGHQLNLLGGPLFFTYKILATIKHCHRLTATYKNANFVPIYWMATEDHDFEEINHFYVFGKKYLWSQNEISKPVGSLSLEGVVEVLDQVTDLPEAVKLCYSTSKTLAEAHQKLVYHLFSEYGILVVDANHPDFKRALLPLLTKELDNQLVYHNVIQQNQRLALNGYKPQVNPRSCNWFLLEGGYRYRVDVLGDDVQLIGAENQTISKEEFVERVNKNPEKLSPNVLLRPLYQQLILPNVAYVGGPGEIACSRQKV